VKRTIETQNLRRRGRARRSHPYEVQLRSEVQWVEGDVALQIGEHVRIGERGRCVIGAAKDDPVSDGGDLSYAVRRERRKYLSEA
jgi:hypothetical protein